MAGIVPEGDMRLAKHAVEVARRSRQKDGDVPLFAAAVAARGGELIGDAFRGEFEIGEHAEYALLERKLKTADLSGATVFSTLEPCTVRGLGAIPCVDRLIKRGVGRVVIGTLDPNPEVRGLGLLALRQAGIQVDLFPPNLTAELEDLNRAYFHKARDVAPVEGNYESRRHLRIILSILSAVIGTAAIVGVVWLGIQNPDLREPVAVIGTVAAIFGIAAWLLRYLGDDYKTFTYSMTEAVFQILVPWARANPTENPLEASARELNALLQQARELARNSRPAIVFSSEDRNQIVQQLSRELRGNLGQEIVGSFEEKYGTAMLKESRLQEMRARFERTRDRLVMEVQALSRRANLNLVIGTLTTVAAVVLLGYIVLNADITVADWRTVLPGYLLRLSLVVFIEVFAFFFLRMYRFNLNEIKYFQNEITNIEARFVALEAAFAHGENEPVSKVLTVLAETERNFILKSGESTVDLERMRAENQTLKDALGSVTAMVTARK